MDDGPMPHVEALVQHAESIRRLSKRTAADLIEIGRLLCECKKLVRHGQWLPWLRREFAWSERTARHYVAVYRLSKSKSAKIADLATHRTSLYLLAAASTPDDARAEVIGRMNAGEAPSRTDVQRIIKKAIQQQVPPRRISIEEYLRRSGTSVFRRLSPIESHFTMEHARKEGWPVAQREAEATATLKKEHRALLVVFRCLQAAAAPPIRKIAAAIPAELRPETADLLKEAADFFPKLRAELTRTSQAEKRPCA